MSAAPSTSRTFVLRRRIRWLTALFMAGLVVSGLTAIPLPAEVNWLIEIMGLEGVASNAPGIGGWLQRIREALAATQSTHPVLFYGTDWLAFGHMAIAVAFIGAWRDPARNRWLFNFGLIACAMVVPWALGFGTLRGIPWWWQLIDCSFGVLGAIPLWLARTWAKELDFAQATK